MAAADKIQFVTPIVTFVYPKLNEPDVYTPKRGKRGKPKYKSDFLATDADTIKLQDYLNKVAKKLMPDVDAPKMPWKVNKEGATVFAVSTGMTDKRTGELIRPPVFDAKRQAIPVEVSIGGGTKGRFSVTVGLYPDEDGITLYINQVQISELVENTYGACVFDEAEGFSYSGTSSTDFDKTAEEDTHDGTGEEGDSFDVKF